MLKASAHKKKPTLLRRLLFFLLHAARRSVIIILHRPQESPVLELRDNRAVTRVGAADKIPKPPPALKTGICENRAVTVGDVFRELEESKARFASMLIADDKDDSMLREYSALS